MRFFSFSILFLFANALSAQWTSQSSGTSAFLTHVFFPTADVGYVIKDDGGVLKTINGGTNWLLKNGANTAMDLHFISADTGIAVAGNEIKRTVDGGGNWITKIIDNNKVFFLICFINKNTGFVIASDSNLNTYTYKTIDSGENWFLQGTSLLASPGDLFFIDEFIGYLVTDVRIFRTNDGGISWAEQFLDSNAFTEIESIFFPSPDTGYAVGGSIYRTLDGGTTWTIQPTPDGNPLYSVYFLTRNVGFVVGGNGINAGSVYKTNDAGNSWFQSTSQIQTFNSVYFPNDTTGYAVGTNGVVIKYYNPDSVPLDTSQSNIINGQCTYNNKVTIFPNPTSTGRIYLNLAGLQGSRKCITISNLFGEKICKSETSDGIYEIDLLDQPKGIFFMEVQSGERFYTHKIIYQ